MYEHKLFKHCRSMQPGLYRIAKSFLIINLVDPLSMTPELNMMAVGDQAILIPGDEFGAEQHAETIQYDRASRLAAYCRTVTNTRSLICPKRSVTVVGCIRSSPPYPQELADILDCTYDALRKARPCDLNGRILRRRTIVDNSGQRSSRCA